MSGLLHRVAAMTPRCLPASLLAAAVLISGCRGETSRPDAGDTAAAPAPAAPQQSVSPDHSPAAPGEVELNFVDQQITPEQVRRAAENRSLRRLRLSGSDIDDAGLQQMLAESRLELLDVVGCENLTADALRSIGRVTTLRNLRLSGPIVTDTSIVELQGLKELAAILLQQTELSDDAAAVLAELPKLREINFFGSKSITDGAVPRLAVLPALEKLRLRGTGVTGEQGDDIEALGQMTRVTELDLSETAFTNAGMPAVAEMPALTQLNLWLTSIDDAGVEHLKTKLNLTSLNLDNVRGVTDASTLIISRMEGLTFLHIGGTSVTYEGLERLQPLKELRTLIVTRLGLSPEEIERLRTNMPWVERLEAD